MMSKETQLEIRILARRGMSIRAIASELAISRNTVRRYLRGEAVKEPARRGPGRPRALSLYEDWLRRRIEGAAPIDIPAPVLHREITAMGYTGSERSVRRYCATIKPVTAEDLWFALRRLPATRRRWTGASTAWQVGGSTPS